MEIFAVELFLDIRYIRIYKENIEFQGQKVLHRN